MYRIELAPGEVTVFRTIEELAIGVRNGVITSRARIYHNASQKWLPIEFHPHYKKALELLATRRRRPRGPEATGTAERRRVRPTRLRSRARVHGSRGRGARAGGSPAGAPRRRESRTRKPAAASPGAHRSRACW